MCCMIGMRDETRTGRRCLLLSTACVHLEMRILAQAIDADQAAFTQPRTLQRFPFFCAPVTARFPAGSNERKHLVSRNSFAEWLAQIRACGRVQTAIPHPVGRHAAPVACRAERRCRGWNDAERGAVREPESLRKSRSKFGQRFNGT